MASTFAVELCLSVFLLCSVSTSTSLEGESPSCVASSSTSKPLDILVVSLPAWGHVNPILAVAEELVARGHRVTMCLGVDDEHKVKLEEKIRTAGVKFCHFSSDIVVQVTALMDAPFYSQVSHMGSAVANYSAGMMRHVSQMFSSETFDLVAGTELMIPVQKCLVSLWDVPTVVVGTTMQAFVHLQPPWAWPGLFQGSSSDDLSFPQRVVSVMEKSFVPILYNSVIVSPSKTSLQSYCPSVSLHEMSFAAGLTLPYFVPTVMGFDYPRTLFPLVEYVGPLLSRSPLAMSAEMADWLSSKPDESVVYISMGSTWKVNRVSAAAMLHGVMQTNYSLLWSLRKSNQYVLDGVELDSSRVLIAEWTPQLTVLGSRAIHSAILHGGFNGLSEAVWNGVPVIGFPQTPEHAGNIGRLYHNQLGLELDASTITSSLVAGALHEIDTGKYRQNCKKVQKLFKFAGGVRRAAELIEYYEEVGYDHLVPAYVKYDWSSVQYYNLDVYAVLLAVLCVALACAVALLRCTLTCAVAKCCKPKLKPE